MIVRKDAGRSPLAFLTCIALISTSFADTQEAHLVQRPLTAADATAGKPLYLRECSRCHGERGDGAGTASVDSRPSPFRQGRFKLRTTESGHPPATDDILRTLQRGIPGTAMSSFASLPEDERKRIAAYVLQLAGLLDTPEPETVHDPGPPPPITPEVIAKGKQIYAEAGCPSCHGTLGNGDGPSVRSLKDADGRPIKPRDFTAGIYRGGGDPADIWYRVATGMDGTPMAAYADSIDPPGLWALTYYLLSLRAPAGTTRR